MPIKRQQYGEKIKSYEQNQGESMKWINWLKNELLFADVSLGAAKEEKSAYDMDMKQVIDIHRAWVNCLHDLVCLQIDRISDFPHESATPPFLLRQWLHGPARKRYGELLEYWILNNAHENFHACSDAILLCCQRGFKDHALLLLNDELPIFSENVQTGVVRLYAAAAEKY
ncbi:MAG: hypothetical protein LBI16_05540 [Burkholderiales bacterium]|jgi:hypothetical protein|nr:hypothetical protein [Burkholderiales bacterium]